MKDNRLPSETPYTPEEIELERQCNALLHRIQTGVMIDQQNGSTDGTPKHLRVGINAAMCAQAALAETLIDAGIIDRTAYMKKRVVVLAREVEIYQQRVAGHLGEQFKI